MALKDNPIIYLSAKLWKYSEGNRKAILLYGSFFLIANLINLLHPLLIAYLLNTIQEQGIHSENIYRLLGILSLFIFLELGFWIFHGTARVMEIKNAFLVEANYKKYLLDGVMDMPLKWHKNHHSGDTIDKIEKGTNALYGFSENTYQIIENLVRLIGSYLALIYFNLHASYLVLFLMIITVITVSKFDHILRKHYKILNKNDNEISAKIYDTISNISTVIILRIEKLLSKAIWRKILSPFNLFSYNTKMNEVKWFTISMFAALMTFLVIGSYLYVVYLNGETILIGTLYALFGYIENINGFFFRFAGLYSGMVRHKANVENAEELAKEFEKKKKIDKVLLGANWKKIYIKNLTFSYEDKKHDLHLKNVSLEFRRGEKIALIGESGSGKTTFLKLFRGLYLPQHVELYVDGKLVPYGFRAIEENITLIPQDPEIFATTIRNNITMGISHKDEYIRRFTDMARFTQVVERLPKKLDSSVVERGVNLSGGEKQRLALSRGLMACEQKSIILLDEPTSSVDSKNELQIYKNIFEGSKDKTIFSSLHKLHLLPYFDTILFFKKGEIIASGSLKELLGSSKEFRGLWKKYVEHSRELEKV